MHTIQYLLRESPTLAPWIAKFRCKKIILGVIRQEGVKNRERVAAYLSSLLMFGEQEKGNLDNLQELGFLQVLLRLSSPFMLNTISGLIFELCLDSTPLVLKNKG